MTLCETQMVSNVIGRYETHKFVEHAMRVGENDHTRRYYTWGPAPDSVSIRNVTKETKLWRPVVPPKVGKPFRFVVDVQFRGSYIGWEENRRRIQNRTNYAINLRWFGRFCEKLGVKLSDVDFEIIRVPLNRPDRPFIKIASRFQADAVMLDQEKFLNILAQGVGNAKAYGFGFLTFE